MNKENKAKRLYVRCEEADGSDYLYRTCYSREEAQTVLDNLPVGDSLYEHLYIVDKELEDIEGD